MKDYHLIATENKVFLMISLSINKKSMFYKIGQELFMDNGPNKSFDEGALVVIEYLLHKYSSLL